MPQKRTLLYIGLALGGYLAYRWYEKNKMTATTSPGTVPVTPPKASTLINPTNIPSSGVIAPSIPSVTPNGIVIPDNVRGLVMLWPNPGLWQSQILPSFTQSDMDMMSSIADTIHYGTPWTAGQSAWFGNLEKTWGTNLAGSY